MRRAKTHVAGLQLGFQHQGEAYLMWKSGRGDHLQENFQKLTDRMSSAQLPPDVVIIHVGSNDLGDTPWRTLRQQLRDGFKAVFDTQPRTRLVWSDIIPRRKYRQGCSYRAMEHMRKKLNRYASALCVHSDGGFISHPIKCGDEALFREDGVHLSSKGTDILLESWGQAIREWLAVWR